MEVLILPKLEQCKWTEISKHYPRAFFYKVTHYSDAIFQLFIFYSGIIKHFIMSYLWDYLFFLKYRTRKICLLFFHLNGFTEWSNWQDGKLLALLSLGNEQTKRLFVQISRKLWSLSEAEEMSGISFMKCCFPLTCSLQKVN